MLVTLVMESNMLGHIFAQAHDADPFHIETLPSVGTVGVHILVVLGESNNGTNCEEAHL